MARADGRRNDELRPVRLERSFIEHAEGSCLIEIGRTRVICTATVDERVPSFCKGTGAGWVIAEYGMLPRATAERSQREVVKGRLSGRTMEISRMVGRALRAVVDLHALGERMVIIDCDVIQADGGTRTASITGGFVALAEALHRLRKEGLIQTLPVVDFCAAVSVGLVGNEVLLDLTYEEDFQAAVDLNLAMTGRGFLVEVQGTAEGRPFSRERLNEMLDLAAKGIRELIKEQREALADIVKGM